jgi:glycosyltransferase involved in cell wall biosynthesis
MNIVIFSNPDFFGTQKRPQFSSMPRYTNMIVEGMTQRGHHVTLWSPKSTFFELPFTGVVKKWMGYIDQYVIFPAAVRHRLKSCSPDTLFVFTDQAQGPWIPLVYKRAHVMHCHDFLAQWSALGKIKENKTGWTGKQYQKYIRKGWGYGKHFIAGSFNTNKELQQLINKPISSDVVYTGLDKSYAPANVQQSRTLLGIKIGIDLSEGYLLHVGGNQWYKNREGVIEIYDAWRMIGKAKLPLLLIGAAPSAKIANRIELSPYQTDIHIISGFEDQAVKLAYAGATVFMFPSLAEGFGWPIAEAMASGCPVITTNEAPMTEVAGSAGYLIPRPDETDDITEWARDAAKVTQQVVELPEKERRKVVAAGIKNAKKFDAETALDQIENIYNNITNEYGYSKALPS